MRRKKCKRRKLKKKFHPGGYRRPPYDKQRISSQCTMVLTLAIALAGFKPLGHTLLQFMIV